MVVSEIHNFLLGCLFDNAGSQRDPAEKKGQIMELDITNSLLRYSQPFVKRCFTSFWYKQLTDEKIAAWSPEFSMMKSAFCIFSDWGI